MTALEFSFSSPPYNRQKNSLSVVRPSSSKFCALHPPALHLVGICWPWWLQCIWVKGLISDVLMCLHPALPWFPKQTQCKHSQMERIRMESSSPALSQTAASVSSGSELAPCRGRREPIRVHKYRDRTCWAHFQIHVQHWMWWTTQLIIKDIP